MTFSPNTDFPAAALERETTGAGVSASLALAPAPNSFPAGAAATHDTARRGLGGMGHHFEAMNTPETLPQRVLDMTSNAIAVVLIILIALLAYFVAGKLGANVALAFAQAGY